MNNFPTIATVENPTPLEQFIRQVTNSFQMVASACEQAMNPNVASIARAAANNIELAANSFVSDKQFQVRYRQGPNRRVLTMLQTAAAAAGQTELSEKFGSILQELSLPFSNFTQSRLREMLCELLFKYFPNTGMGFEGVNYVVTYVPETQQTYHYAEVVETPYEHDGRPDRVGSAKLKLKNQLVTIEIDQKNKNGAHVRLHLNLSRIGVTRSPTFEVAVLHDPLEGHAYPANLSFVDFQFLTVQLDRLMKAAGYDDSKNDIVRDYNYTQFVKDFKQMISSVDLPKFVTVNLNRKPWVSDSWTKNNLDCYWRENPDELFWVMNIDLTDTESFILRGINHSVQSLECRNVIYLWDEGQMLFKADGEDSLVPFQFDNSVWLGINHEFRRRYEILMHYFKEEVTKDVELWKKMHPGATPTAEEFQQFRNQLD